MDVQAAMGASITEKLYLDWRLVNIREERKAKMLSFQFTFSQQTTDK